MNIYCEQILSLENNKYTQTYLRIILKAQNRASSKLAAKPIVGYTEEHHIVPKSFKIGGIRDPLNYAYLTAREHFICHLLLERAFRNSPCQG